MCEKFKPIRESKPKLGACLPDYYTHAEQGKRDESAEDILATLESLAAPVIRNLAKPGLQPAPKQMANLYVFIAFMFARVPSWRNNLDRMFSHIAKQRHLALAGDKERFHKMCADVERKTGEPLGMGVEELRQYLLKGQYKIVQTSTAYKLRTMFESAISVASEMKEFGFEVLYAPTGRFFVTSDSPVFTLRPESKRGSVIGVGFGLSNVIVHFPLNKRACLRLRRGVEPSGFYISERHLDEINRLTMTTATRCLYSPEGNRRIARLFDQWGCKAQPGKNTFMLEPPSQSPPHR